MQFRTLKEKRIEKSTTYHSQQGNLLNNQQLYQPRTCLLKDKSIVGGIDGKIQDHTAINGASYFFYYFSPTPKGASVSIFLDISQYFSILLCSLF